TITNTAFAAWRRPGTAVAFALDRMPSREYVVARTRVADALRRRAYPSPPALGPYPGPAPPPGGGRPRPDPARVTEGRQVALAAGPWLGPRGGQGRAAGRPATLGHQHGGARAGAGPRVRGLNREPLGSVRPLPAPPARPHPWPARGQPPPVRPAQAVV